jgi:hypothetical protein
VNRDRYKTVTNKESFVLLIPASRNASEGEATFLNEGVSGLPDFVRSVGAHDIERAERSLKGPEATKFSALLALRGALEADDPLAMRDAVKRIKSAYSLEEEELRRYNWPADIPFMRPGPQASKHPSRLLTFEISQMVGNLNTNIVLWWNAGRFYPGIFCLDMTTALYVHTFFIAPTGGLGFRICPHCHDQFLQDRPNKEYCCPAHREAHRVARFRCAKKHKESQPDKTRRKHVSQKAR